jgi:hypothetical protein
VVSEDFEQGWLAEIAFELASNAPPEVSPASIPVACVSIQEINE